MKSKMMFSKFYRSALVMLLFVLSLSLIGCGNKAATDNNNADSNNQQQETAAGADQPQNNDNSNNSGSNLSADVSFERVDRSVQNAAGQTVVERYYDQAVLAETCEQYTAINQQLQTLANEFFNDTDIITEDYEMAQGTAAEPTAAFPYCSKTDGEVTFNQEGWLSIKLTSHWQAGGVNNTDYSGANYNLKTGQKLELTDIFSMGDDELLAYLVKQSLDYMAAHPEQGWWQNAGQDANAIVACYPLEKFTYYIEGSNVCLCYKTYELGPGAMGPVVVSCPIKWQLRC